MAEDKNILEVRNLSKTYKDRQMVKDIDLTIKKGSFTALLGTNGAGKSTTISMLTLMKKPSLGSISYDGLSADKHGEEIRTKIGLVAQGSYLDDVLTVEDNLHLWAGLYKKIGEDRIKEVVALTQLEDILNHKVKELSGGQRRRADIALAILHQPEILYLDEPTTGLDIQTRTAIWELLQEMRVKEGLTIFLTSHYLDEASSADNVYIIDSGQIIAHGSAADLIKRYSKKRLTILAGDFDSIKKELDLSQSIFPISLDFDDSAAAIATLERLKAYIKDFDYRSGNMDDVFLTLTGREMH
ncbi:ABC transporter ATP-binding protein [Streptococcaceae bacterium ESL0687]|nr:ABC transporter ATP-binding protein [Streptococcaceae bacterium ESL0687]